MAAAGVQKTQKTVVTHLEMLADPKLHCPYPTGKHVLIRCEKPPLDFYRYLHGAVGKPHFWISRQKLSDQALSAIIHDDQVELYVLYRAGAPAGFFELDFRQSPQAELSFLGLVPDAIGRGLGRFLLCEAVSMAWSRNPVRLIVQTCTLDHPRALPLYQRSGFRPYSRTEVELEI